MTKHGFDFGDRVVITNGEWAGRTGIVSWPVSGANPRYVLLCSDDKIAGVPVSIGDISDATPEAKGFTQLTYQLNRLSSFLIEKTFL